VPDVTGRIALGALIVAAAAGSAFAAPARDEVIRPGKAIGRVSLGMSEAHVRKALGRPLNVLRERVGFGREVVELQYEGRGLFVRLGGRASALRVVAVSTFARGERTPDGLGVGSLERSVLRRYGRRFECRPLDVVRYGEVSIIGRNSRECAVPEAGGSVRTVFVSAIPNRTPWDVHRASSWAARARVIEVSVRAS
jgi:hypothetical protein